MRQIARFNWPMVKKKFELVLARLDDKASKYSKEMKGFMKAIVDEIVSVENEADRELREELLSDSEETE